MQCYNFEVVNNKKILILLERNSLEVISLNKN